eukprot:7382635-Prymnesium_polylepis.1
MRPSKGPQRCMRGSVPPGEKLWRQSGPVAQCGRIFRGQRPPTQGLGQAARARRGGCGGWGGWGCKLQTFDVKKLFRSGCDRFCAAAYKRGDPFDFLHPKGHPHLTGRHDKSRQGCNPPVHGNMVMGYLPKGHEDQSNRLYTYEGCRGCYNKENNTNISSCPSVQGTKQIQKAK